MGRDLLTIKEAAYALDLSARTVRRWIDEGRLEAVHVGPTNRVRVGRDVVEAAMRPRRFDEDEVAPA